MYEISYTTFRVGLQAESNTAGPVATHFMQKEIAMLILARRAGESIIIELPTGEQITDTVLGIKGNQVRIGTDAPDEIAIVREELLDKVEN